MGGAHLPKMASPPPHVHRTFLIWQARKGWDVLLRSYLDEFNSEDDVVLYLRTSLDRSNRCVQGQPAALQRPDPPRVHVSRCGASTCHRRELATWINRYLCGDAPPPRTCHVDDPINASLAEISISAAEIGAPLTGRPRGKYARAIRLFGSLRGSQRDAEAARRARWFCAERGEEAAARWRRLPPIVILDDAIEATLFPGECMRLSRAGLQQLDHMADRVPSPHGRAVRGGRCVCAAVARRGVGPACDGGDGDGSADYRDQLVRLQHA